MRGSALSLRAAGGIASRVVESGARHLPTGTVTLLFTDVEGSTRLLDELGSERYGEADGPSRADPRGRAAHRGVEVGTEGDAFFFVFTSAADGLAAAGEMQAALADGSVRVRMGIHSGEVMLVDDDYVGMAVHKAARICSAAHGGQVVVSAQTRALAGVALRDLGEHRLKDLTAPERLFQLGEGKFPPLRTLRRGHLPVQATPLIGRERELAELVELADASADHADGNGRDGQDAAGARARGRALRPLRGRGVVGVPGDGDRPWSWCRDRCALGR